MIYSKDRDFLFLKGRKVAGTSVEIALSALCGPEDIITPVSAVDELQRLSLGYVGAQNYSVHPREEKAYLDALRSSAGQLANVSPPRAKYKNHMGFCQFVLRFGATPTDRIFCVERCPYAKIISRANTVGRLKSYATHGTPMISSLEQLRKTISKQIERGRLSVKNISKYCDADGKLVARVLRFESLREDFASLLNEFGISSVPELPHAKPGLQSNDIDPRSVFTREQLDYVNRVFEREFELFGYEPI